MFFLLSLALKNNAADYSNFKLALERVCRNERATFRSASTVSANSLQSRFKITVTLNLGAMNNIFRNAADHLPQRPH